MTEAAGGSGPGRELYVRHARIDGRSVVLLRAIDHGERCIVEAEVWPDGAATEPDCPDPYAFSSPVEATRFVTHAVEAFIALGCEVSAS